MKKVKLSVVLALALSVSLIGTGAQADTHTATITATATLGTPAVGTRTLSTIPAVALVTSGSTASSSFTVSVVEVAAAGINGWFVTANSGDFAKTDLPAGASIAASNFVYSRTSGSETATPAGTLSGTINPGSSGPLDGNGQTLFSVSEDPNSFTGYSGTYTSLGTVTLTPPAGTTVGIYTATVTITLVA